jgi:hypothetical protein
MQGFSVMGLNRLEGALLLLYDLLEDSAARAPPAPSPAQTKTQEVREPTFMDPHLISQSIHLSLQ